MTTEIDQRFQSLDSVQAPNRTNKPRQFLAELFETVRIIPLIE
jgi:hypothetical protein